MSTTQIHSDHLDRHIAKLGDWSDGAIAVRVAGYREPWRLGTFQRAVIAEAQRRGLVDA